MSYGGAIASSPANLETARWFGQRVADIAARVHR